MIFKGFKIGKSKEKPDRDTSEAGDTTTAQAAEMEEQINNRTKDLEEAEQQIKKLTDTANGSEEAEEAPPQPHGPLSELTVEPEDELTDKDADAGTLLEEAEEEVKVVEVGNGAAAPAEAEKEPAKVEGNNSLSDLFSQDDEEENPLASLISSMPDVTAQELLDDLQEIKGIIKEWQQS